MEKMTDKMLLDNLRKTKKNLEQRLNAANEVIKALENGLHLFDADDDSSIKFIMGKQRKSLTLAPLSIFNNGTGRVYNRRFSITKCKELTESILEIFRENPESSWRAWEIQNLLIKKYPDENKEYIRQFVSSKFFQWSGSNSPVVKVSRGIYKLKTNDGIN